jgi:hypothetical protein
MESVTAEGAHTSPCRRTIPVCLGALELRVARHWEASLTTDPMHIHRRLLVDVRYSTTAPVHVGIACHHRGLL